MARTARTYNPSEFANLSDEQLYALLASISTANVPHRAAQLRDAARSLVSTVHVPR
jgi:hypothetical protein